MVDALAANRRIHWHDADSQTGQDQQTASRSGDPVWVGDENSKPNPRWIYVHSMAPVSITALFATAQAAQLRSFLAGRAMAGRRAGGGGDSHALGVLGAARGAGF